MTGRLDAVWGSRRLSLKDIEASYRLRYHHNAVLGSFSYIGSHLLSAAYLFLFGRYISDTLSGVRAVRAGVSDEPARAARRQAGQPVSALARFSRRRPMCSKRRCSFFALSPERVRRTTPVEGLRSLAIIAWQRIAPMRHARPPLRASRDAAAADPKVSRRAAVLRLFSIIPAAGAGTRLQSSTPKVLTPVNGRPMIDHLFDRYSDVVRRFVLVVHPSFEVAMSGATCSAAAPDLDVDYAHAGAAYRHARCDSAGSGCARRSRARSRLDHLVRSDRRPPGYDRDARTRCRASTQSCA